MNGIEVSRKVNELHSQIHRLNNEMEKMDLTGLQFQIKHQELRIAELTILQTLIEWFESDNPKDRDLVLILENEALAEINGWDGTHEAFEASPMIFQLKQILKKCHMEIRK